MTPTPHPDHQFQPQSPAREHSRGYSRADAIADGLLIEVPIRLSGQFGISWPLAVSTLAWFDAVAALVTLAQATPDTDPRVPDVCAALAILAYRYGDGALARVAIDRSRRLSPGHRLTDLVDQLVTIGVPPEALDEVLAY